LLEKGSYLLTLLGGEGLIEKDRNAWRRRGQEDFLSKKDEQGDVRLVTTEKVWRNRFDREGGRQLHKPESREDYYTGTGKNSRITSWS